MLRTTLLTHGCASCAAHRVACVLLLLLAGCAAQGNRHLPATAVAAPLEERAMFGLSTAARLHPGLLRGGQPSEAALAWLRRQGVRTIVNLRRDALAGEPATAARLGLDYVAIPLDASTPPTLDEIERFMSTVTDPARQPVYVHCKHGVDRTGALAAVYRMEVDGWSPEAATDEMLQLGFHRIWLDLRRFVERYRPLGRWRHLSAASTPGPAAPVSPVGAAP